MTEFRINQQSDDLFRIEGKKENNKWSVKSVPYRLQRVYCNLEDAQKAIQDYYKYPIIHEVTHTIE